MVEDITDFGAEPNPDDGSLTAAEDNIRAIWEAASEVGAGGTIHIPAGTYYVGTADRSIPVSFGAALPAGISITGDGPDKSVLVVTEHLPDGQNHSLFYWWEDADHGQVEVRDLKLDGNYENLGNLRAANSGARACIIRAGVAGGDFTFDNVHFRGWYNSAIRHNDVPETITRCTFEELGIGINQDTGGDTVGHGSELNFDGADNATIERCLFTRISGDAVNLNSGTGTVTLNNCYGEALGNGVHKYQWGGECWHNNCYWEPHHPWLVDNLPDPGDIPPFHGRNFAHRRGSNDPSPSFVFNNVKVNGTTLRGMAVNDGDAEVSGDMIAFHNISSEGGFDVCFQERDGFRFAFDVDRMSVHGTGGEVFDCPNAAGSIATLTHGDNTRGLGDMGNISIGSSVEGGDPLAPTVPNRSDVGAGSEAPSGGSGDEPMDIPESSVGKSLAVGVLTAVGVKAVRRWLN